ncbi:MAG: hypothetical protein IT365_00080 [Candidatus Hydrogenedentes bacterium]|nr:hypothetical protein [Candidatus Hydrogenedentota bacterium]
MRRRIYIVLSCALLSAVALGPIVHRVCLATRSTVYAESREVDASVRPSEAELGLQDAEKLQTGDAGEVVQSRAVSELLSNLDLGSGPQIAPGAGSRLAEADALREQSTPAEAIRAYILVLDQFPDTPQAKAADERIAFLLGGRTEAELDAIEAALPSPKELTNVDGITALGQFYFKRAGDAGEGNPELAAKYLQLIYDIGWGVFQDDLDDHYKSKLLMGYLFAADALGKGEERRVALSAYANTLEPCFTSWLIKFELDGKELPFDYVKSEKGRESVRRYYAEKAGEQSSPAVSASYYAKARDASLQMLIDQPREIPVLDHGRYYLDAAAALGEEQRAAAVARLEAWIANEPLSIMRWVVRYELAMFLTGGPATSAEARAGFHHFEVMLDEAEKGIVEEAIDNIQIDEGIRGLLVCMWGHANAGTNRIEDAEVCYNWVLTYFTNETHAGSSAAYSLALMEQRKNLDDPAVGVAALEEFARSHPGNNYSGEALMEVAYTQICSDDAALAMQTYERIEKEYWDTSIAEKARKSRDKLTRQMVEHE